mmetsp:Transcript_12839/g.16868  ORF Transcript_12839/g.16868 Transcript_12839/m.16868 type:complete len:99 (+) Transcript_12839:350-646(+)
MLSTRSSLDTEGISQQSSISSKSDSFICVCGKLSLVRQSQEDQDQDQLLQLLSFCPNGKLLLCKNLVGTYKMKSNPRHAIINLKVFAGSRGSCKLPSS